MTHVVADRGVWIGCSDSFDCLLVYGLVVGLVLIALERCVRVVLARCMDCVRDLLRVWCSCLVTYKIGVL